jgi:hypothetical protein
MNYPVFDLEQELLSCWQITSDLKLLEEGILEKDMTRDDINNVVLGLRTLYELKFDKAWNSFEKITKEYHQMRKRNESRT